MNKSILKIALPATVSNIVVPLLGLMDLSIAGHLGVTACIGAVAVGATMLNLTYWNFGFLRMGTSGLTAQAYGRQDKKEAAAMLHRSALLAFSLGTAAILLNRPLRWLLLAAVGPSPEVEALASRYFSVCIYGAPALLATMAFSGWFIGMQNAVCPMAVSIAVNVINVAVSLLCVFPLGMGFIGIAVGTTAAQWCGLALCAACYLHVRKKEGLPATVDLRRLTKGIGGFFRTNSDIFLRSLCIMLVTLFFTSAGARDGDTVLAVNAIIMQLYLFYSYFMDGFAYAGEALAGRLSGAGDTDGLRQCARRLLAWGGGVMTVFAIAYGAFGESIMPLLTDDTAVLSLAADYRFWAAAIPVAGMAAFIWDGVFTGVTATRQMLAALLCATAAFFAIFFSATFIPDPNDRLWLAFLSYLLIRGLILTVMFRKIA